MSDYTTYFIGAGASFNAIPVYQNVEAGKESFKENLTYELKQFAEIKNVYTDEIVSKNMHSGEFQTNIEKLSLELNTDINWIEEETKGHYTVDTLARRLALLNDKPNLKRLKALLSIYFLKKQIPDKYDPRYDTLLAALLEENSNDPQSKTRETPAAKLPDNIKIISWNYDYQIEMAYGKYCGYPPNLISFQEDLKVFPRDHAEAKVAYIDDINIVKLNGTAAYYTDQDDTISHFEKYISASIFQPDNYIKYLKAYRAAKNYKGENSIFNFAWERNKITDHSLKLAQDIISETTKLIIIGYSFPYYNRIIDKAIFYSLNKAEEIVIQDKNPQRVSSLFLKRINPDDLPFLSKIIREESYTDQFILPED
ncbi:MAG TPA: hypothetical protein VJY62_12925 [Bacteroidia bacterium]|nr:hypothetical protein [Bacteroidia bacterium]